MSDAADIASEIEQEAIRIALLNHRVNQPTQGLSHCKECGEPIPAFRTSSVKAIRCVECQRVFEANQRLLRRA